MIDPSTTSGLGVPDALMQRVAHIAGHTSGDLVGARPGADDLSEPLVMAVGPRPVDRQRVFEMVCEGVEDEQIAEALGVTLRAVRRAVREVCAETGLPRTRRTFFRRAAQVRAYLSEHGHWPPASGETLVLHEFVRRVRGQVATQDERLTPGMRAHLDLALPGWNGADLPTRTAGARLTGTDPQWCEKADELGSWMRAHGRRPIARCDADDEQQRRLARLLTTLRRRAVHDLLHPERRAYLDDVAPGWDS